MAGRLVSKRAIGGLTQTRWVVGNVKRQQGVSLVEVIVVVALLGVVSVTVAPSLSTVNPHKLDLAASEIAGAIRFARSEAVRTGQPHGIAFELGGLAVKVFRASAPANPGDPVGVPAYDVYDPISKHPYSVNLNEHAFAEVDGVVKQTSFVGSCVDQDLLYFDSAGSAWCGDPGNALLDEATLDYVFDGQSRTVKLDGVTGRVIVQ